MGLPDLSSLSLEPRPAPTAVVVGADGMTKHGDARAFDLVPGHMYDVLPDGLQKEVKSDDFTLVLPNECSVMKFSMAALIVSLTAKRQELVDAVLSRLGRRADWLHRAVQGGITTTADMAESRSDDGTSIPNQAFFGVVEYRERDQDNIEAFLRGVGHRVAVYVNMKELEEPQENGPFVYLGAYYMFGNALYLDASFNRNANTKRTTDKDSPTYMANVDALLSIAAAFGDQADVQLSAAERQLRDAGRP
tara:strand:+ start:2968 stop:3714 length:747 start_codon:yes stop_codon:yes gene_type:complete